MKSITKNIAGLALVAASVIPSAALARAWSPAVTVASIETTDGNVWASFSSKPTAHNCPMQGTEQYELGGGAVNVSNMYQALLAAQLSGRPVQILWSGKCSANGYALLDGVWLK